MDRSMFDGDQANAGRRLGWRSYVLAMGLVAGLVVAVILFMMFAGWGLMLGPSVAQSPNHGRSLTDIGDPTDEQVAERGASRQLRVEVGPPTASLQLWIFEAYSQPISINLADRWAYTFNGEDRPMMPAANASRGTIVVLHGLYDHTEGYMGEWGRIFAAAGYRAIVLDLRGHGRSTGDWITYGVIESRDLSQVIDALEAEGLIAGQLGVFGTSFGGAVGLQAAAIDPRIDAIVSVSTFSSLPAVAEPFGRRLVTHRLGNWAWLMVRHAVPQVIGAAGRAAGFNPADASPEQAIGRISAPVLLVHGTADRHVPYEHALALQAASDGAARLELIERATHMSLPFQRLDQLRALALDFFDKSLTPESTTRMADTGVEDDSS